MDHPKIDSRNPILKANEALANLRAKREAALNQTFRIQCLQHVPFEGPGYINEWADRNGYPFQLTRLYANDPYPKTEDYDLLVIMGGPMSVHDVGFYRWMKDEKIFIQSAIKSNKAILGICLGAQLIAEALGAAVRPNNDTEIGWFLVSRAPEIENTEFRKLIPPEFMAFHWHGETFDLPYQATRLAGNNACVNQAFMVGDRIIGLQFHLETRWEDVDRIVAHCKKELESTGPYIQTVESMIYEHRFYEQTHKIMTGLLAFLRDVSEIKMVSQVQGVS